MADSLLQSKLPITETFDAEYLSYYGILPLELTPDRLRVAVTGRPNPGALEDLEQSYGLPLDLIQVDEAELKDAIRIAFAASETVGALVRDLDVSVGPAPDHSDENLTDVRDLANQPPVIRFVNLLIREAHDVGASDIHLEAVPEGLRARLRLDGVLSDLPSPPKGLQAAVVSRIKLLAELDIAQRRAPQDGRFRVRLESRELDLRVSTVPTVHGESVVLRLLERGGETVGLDALGMDPETLATFRRLTGKTHGIVLVTGPTGSGKTTTLYAALRLRDASREKIITVEDPVEYQLPGVTQMPVHEQAGVSFATALRSILRQDPDVLMVGEMRDAETAAIAVQAAMTGHLVFSTLHTNDAASAVTRLVDLRVEPYMIAATMEGVLAQRLVRKVCPECRERYRPTPEATALVAGQPVGSPPVLERGRGCTRCRQTGYLGRTGIFELLVVDADLADRLARTPGLDAIRSLSRERGLRTLIEDGWHKVQAGITTIEEVLRVLGT